MRETKLVNKTGSDIDLKEETALELSLLCDNLKDGKAKRVKVTSQGSTGYWCTESGNVFNHVVLNSDTCVKYREIHVLRVDGSFTCIGVKRHSLWDVMRLRPLWEVMKLWPPREVEIDAGN